MPSPAELNAAALRAGLLCCHVNCACHLFTFDLAEHFMIRTKASSDFELGGDWAGARQDGERGRRSAATFCWLLTGQAKGAAAWDLVIIVSRKIGTGEISVDSHINIDNSVPEFSGGFLQFDPWSVKVLSQPVAAKVAMAR